jgi:hypothetical protein
MKRIYRPATVPPRQCRLSRRSGHGCGGPRRYVPKAIRESELFPPKGQEHCDALAVLPILVAEELDQISFFKRDADKDVSGRYKGEEQMACSHHGRRPKGDDEAKIYWVPHELIEHWSFETRLRSGLSR